MKETPKKEQTMRIADDELDFIKQQFANNDQLLRSIRALMYGLDVLPTEKSEIKKAFSSPLALRTAQKLFLPSIADDVPIGQCIDSLMTIKFDGQSVEQSIIIVEARERMMGMMATALKLLEDPEGLKVTTELGNLAGTERLTQLIARNSFIVQTDQSLLQIKLLAGQKTETVEQTKKRLQADSSR